MTGDLIMDALNKGTSTISKCGRKSQVVLWLIYIVGFVY